MATPRAAAADAAAPLRALPGYSRRPPGTGSSDSVSKLFYLHYRGPTRPHASQAETSQFFLLGRGSVGPHASINDVRFPDPYT